MFFVCKDNYSIIFIISGKTKPMNECFSNLYNCNSVQISVYSSNSSHVHTCLGRDCTCCNHYCHSYYTWKLNCGHDFSTNQNCVQICPYKTLYSHYQWTLLNCCTVWHSQDATLIMHLLSATSKWKFFKYFF